MNKVECCFVQHSSRIDNLGKRKKEEEWEREREGEEKEGVYGREGERWEEGENRNRKGTCLVNCIQGAEACQTLHPKSIYEFSPLLLLSLSLSLSLSISSISYSNSHTHIQQLLSLSHTSILPSLTHTQPVDHGH